MIYAKVYYNGEQTAYKPLMTRGDEETRNFAAHSNTDVPLGGISIALDPDQVSKEDIESLYSDLLKLYQKR